MVCVGRARTGRGSVWAGPGRAEIRVGRAAYLRKGQWKFGGLFRIIYKRRTGPKQAIRIGRLAQTRLLPKNSRKYENPKTSSVHRFSHIFGMYKNIILFKISLKTFIYRSKVGEKQWKKTRFGCSFFLDVFFSVCLRHLYEQGESKIEYQLYQFIKVEWPKNHVKQQTGTTKKTRRTCDWNHKQNHVK